MESSEPSEPASLADAARRSSVPDVPLHQTDLEAGQPASGFPASDATALDNARRGTWVINDYLDGGMLLGANGRPVMRADGARVAFWFRDADRLAQELTTAEGGEAPAAKKPVGLASFESGFDRDWDPGTRRAYFADVTKSARLLAYHYVQTTEPEEAVRRAVATVLGDRVAVSEGSINAFAPKRYHLAAVKVANALRDELVGPESDAAEPPEPSVVLGTTTNEENGTPDAVQQSGNDFDDVADAWLEKTLSGLVGALDAESSEDARVRLHELADKLKPFAEFTRAIAEQHTTITSGKFEVDKLLGPARAILNLARDPDGAAILMALMAGGKTSQINSKI